MTRYYRLNDGGVVWPERKYIACGMDRKGGKQVVVISPEDREQVERLLGVLAVHFATDFGAQSEDMEAMQAALREFANPTPPKPDEPLSVGSLAEDGDKRLWVRTAWATWRCISEEGLDARLWGDFTTVEVLR